MKCPACGAPDNTVIRSKATVESVRRTRQCDTCGKRWVTIEAPEELHDAAREIRERFLALGRACGVVPGEG